MEQIAKITCDGFSYWLPGGEHSGSNLRAFFGIEDDHDLWGEGDKEATLIPNDPNYKIDLESGMKFYSAFKEING